MLEDLVFFALTLSNYRLLLCFVFVFVFLSRAVLIGVRFGGVFGRLVF
jgi:hypothetical protein